MMHNVVSFDRARQPFRPKLRQLRATQASLYNDCEVSLCILYVLSPRFRRYIASSDPGCGDFQSGEAAVLCSLEEIFGI